ncbi:MAG: CarD family transcriptional regulator, partial [Chloroflexota bacterium]
MNLSALLAAFRALPEYPDLLQRAGRDSLALGLPRAARLPLAAALATDLNRPVLLITARSDRALLFNEELPAWLPPHSQTPIHFFPEPNPLPYEHAPWGPRTIQQRIATLSALAHPRPHTPTLIITSARALLTRTLPKRDFAAATRSLRLGQSVRLDKLLESWIGAGYSNETIVVEPGQFSRRGGIVDVWPPTDSLPTRIELFGDEVEHLRRFDPATQRSGENVDAVTISPAREALPKNGPPLSGLAANPESDLAADFERLAQGAAFPALEYYLPLLHTTSASLLDYLPDNTLVFVDDWSALADTINELETQALELRADAIDTGLITRDFPAPNLSWSDLQDDLTRLPLIHLGRLEDEVATADSILLSDYFSPGPRFGGQVKQVLDHLQSFDFAQDKSPISNLQSAIVVTRQAARLAELWNEHNPPLAPAEDLTELAPIAFIQGALADGFTLQLPLTTYHLLTDSEIFGWVRPEPRRRRTAAERAEPPEAAYAYADFNPGDIVVHIDYGIGRFGGLEKISLPSPAGEGSGVRREQESIRLVYKDNDTLYISIHSLHQVSKYGSKESEAPKLDKLGSNAWTSLKTKTKRKIKELAFDLVKLYAERKSKKGFAFSPDNYLQNELEASFIYEDTPDQLKATNDVKRDMEQEFPMDRLVCGDVGFGKTEIAIRAAFKAAIDGKQTAVLVPTT